MKIGFFITARLKSARLEKKILLDINGKPIIQHIIDRCKATKGIDGVVLCTSINPQDSLLYDFAIRNQIQFYPGSEVDVLDRLMSAAEYYGYNAFLSITADNPLFSIYTSQMLIDWSENEDFDFMFTKGLPMGVATSFIKAKALKVANFMKKKVDTEIWGPFVNKPDFFKIGELHVVNSPFKEKVRITCDYPEDYELFKKIYSFFKIDQIPKLQEYIKIINENPEILSINSMHTQKMLDKKKLEDINKSFEENKMAALKFAESIGLNLDPGLKIKKVEI